MTNAKRLARLLRVIAEEAKANASFADRLALAWEGEGVQQVTGTPSRVKREGEARRRGKRRAPAVLDPLVAYRDGEEALRASLAKLTIDELKDIVAEHGMDSRKLAMKWKAPDRLIDLIVDTVRERVNKGSVFRHGSAGSRGSDSATSEQASSLGEPQEPRDLASPNVSSETAVDSDQTATNADDLNRPEPTATEHS